MQELPEAIVVLYERLADYLIADICSRFKYNETATATTILHIKQLLKNGYDLDNINKYIKKTLKLTDAEFSKAWSNALGENQRYFDTIITDQSRFDRGVVRRHDRGHQGADARHAEKHHSDNGLCGACCRTGSNARPRRYV